MPLSQIARLDYDYEEPILWRRNRDIVLTVRGDVIDNVQPPDVTNAVLPKLKPIKDALPYGYRIETGGSIEESAKANAALVGSVPDDGDRDAGAPDDPAAELLAARAGVRDRAARADRRDRRAARSPTGRSASWRCSA